MGGGLHFSSVVPWGGNERLSGFRTIGYPHPDALNFTSLR